MSWTKQRQNVFRNFTHKNCEISLFPNSFPKVTGITQARLPLAGLHNLNVHLTFRCKKCSKDLKPTSQNENIEAKQFQPKAILGTKRAADLIESYFKEYSFNKEASTNKISDSDENLKIPECINQSITSNLQTKNQNEIRKSSPQNRPILSKKIKAKFDVNQNATHLVGELKSVVESTIDNHTVKTENYFNDISANSPQPIVQHNKNEHTNADSKSYQNSTIHWYDKQKVNSSSSFQWAIKKFNKDEDRKIKTMIFTNRNCFFRRNRNRIHSMNSKNPQKLDTETCYNKENKNFEISTRDNYNNLPNIENDLLKNTNKNDHINPEVIEEYMSNYSDPYLTNKPLDNNSVTSDNNSSQSDFVGRYDMESMLKIAIKIMKTNEAKSMGSSTDRKNQQKQLSLIRQKLLSIAIWNNNEEICDESLDELESQSQCSINTHSVQFDSSVYFSNSEFLNSPPTTKIPMPPKKWISNSLAFQHKLKMLPDDFDNLSLEFDY